MNTLQDLLEWCVKEKDIQRKDYKDCIKRTGDSSVKEELNGVIIGLDLVIYRIKRIMGELSGLSNL